MSEAPAPNVDLENNSPPRYERTRARKAIPRLPLSIGFIYPIPLTPQLPPSPPPFLSTIYHCLRPYARHHPAHPPTTSWWRSRRTPPGAGPRICHSPLACQSLRGCTRRSASPVRESAILLPYPPSFIFDDAIWGDVCTKACRVRFFVCMIY